MGKLRITLACWDYDRTAALANGTIVADGLDINYLSLPVEETFFRMLRNKEFEVSEMSLSSYCVSLMKKDPDFIAIPVFPSRLFRHNSIFIHADSGIKVPTDLIGKKIGTPEYQMTAPVWIRGILEEHHQVPHTSVQYLTGGAETTGRDEKIKLQLPPEVKIAPIGPTQTLSSMIASGELDAMHTARVPSTFYSQPKKVKRLFENYQEVESDYFKKTRILPIMHTIVIRKDVYEKNRWMAQSLFKAFVQAQQITYQSLREVAALKTMLPWLPAHVEQLERELGPDWWAYGFQSNRHVLETFLRYHHQQGLSQRLLKPEELFAPETFEAFKI
jgi:4,5-dihydroxyphthalate decarboxylase